MSQVLKVYDRDTRGQAAAVLHSADGTVRVLHRGDSITQIRGVLGKIKADNDLRGVPVDTLRGQAFQHEGASHLSVVDNGAPADFTVAERFSMGRDLLEIVVEGDGTAAMLVGRGGTGKTHLVLDVLAKAGVEKVDANESTEEECDGEGFVYMKGALAATELFKLLYNNRRKIIVFDDADSCMDDENRINILKAVLDTYDERIVSWKSPFLENQGYEHTFEFEGKIIFASNRKWSQIPQALKSRSLLINLDMTDTELCDHVGSISDHLLPTLTEQQRADLIDHIRTIAPHLKDMSIRTFQNAVKMMAKPNWRALARFAL